MSKCVECNTEATHFTPVSKVPICEAHFKEAFMEGMQELIDNGELEQIGSRVRLTPKGHLQLRINDSKN